MLKFQQLFETILELFYNQKDLEMVEKLKQESKGSNTTVWFGHYPTSTVWSPYPGIRSLMR